MALHYAIWILFYGLKPIVFNASGLVITTSVSDDCNAEQVPVKQYTWRARIGNYDCKHILRILEFDICANFDLMKPCASSEEKPEY